MPVGFISFAIKFGLMDKVTLTKSVHSQCDDCVEYLFKSDYVSVGWIFTKWFEIIAQLVFGF